LAVLPNHQGSEVMKAKNILMLIVICQYVPRLIRIRPIYLQMTRSAGAITETAGAGAAFNLVLYMLASHVSVVYLLFIKSEWRIELSFPAVKLTAGKKWEQLCTVEIKEIVK
jgi:cyclic nucleotide gated channel, plant